jgi:predicted dehydrogenase
VGTTRREFLKTAAAVGSVPYILTGATTRAADKNSKPTIAAIGVGGKNGRYSRGGAVAEQAGRLGQMIAVCDVDAEHTAGFSQKYGGKLAEYGDYRKLFDKEKPDVVTIGTPDHWHVPIAIAALRNGADVYCEKPLTLTIEEGKQIAKVVKETGKVFQVGTQQRTEFGRNFIRAVAIAQSGRLGERVNAKIAIGAAPGDGPFKSTEVPKGLDWDMWVGPAAQVPYMVERRKMFRWFLEYSGGKMTDWGAHHIDIAQWAMGYTNGGPVAVSGNGQFGKVVPEKFDFVAFFAGDKTLPDGFNCATKFDINLTYDNGATMNVTDSYKSEDGKTAFGNGILLEGDRGRIFVNRGKLSGAPVEEMTDAEKKDLDEAVVKLYGAQPGGHMQNFFDCLESRKDPVSDVYSHHRTMTSCHLCNINLMLGRDLKWDPQAEEFIGDEQANALMSRPRRSPYTMEV